MQDFFMCWEEFNGYRLQMLLPIKYAYKNHTSIAFNYSAGLEMLPRLLY